MTVQPQTLDALFHALADPTRRQVLADLARGPATVGQLAETHRMALPSFLAHVRKLEAAGLVTTSKTGRIRTCAVVPSAFDPLRGWLDDQKVLWDQRLDRLEDYLTNLMKDRKNGP